MTDRELDALVAEKVFGKIIFTYEEMRDEAEKIWAKQPHCYQFLRGFNAWKDDNGTTRCEQRFGRFSTEISAAWLVVEKMRQLGWYFEIDCGNASCTPHARFSVYGKGRGEASDLAPRAICLAALKALGIELPTPSSTESE